MVNGVDGRSEFPLARNNLWIDVPALADGRKWNPEEGKQLVSMLESSMPGYRIRCGTIHTTQGKGADLVIMVLGTATDQRRARSWASGTPNLLNAAITRARRCLVVIGDYENWSNLRNFAELAGHSGGLLQK